MGGAERGDLGGVDPRGNPGPAAAILADPLAKMPISRVTVADIERWHALMRRAGVGEVAIKNRHTGLRTAFTQAVRWGWLSTNPAATARHTHAKRLPALRWSDLAGRQAHHRQRHRD